MAEYTAWGRWLENALRARQLKPVDLTRGSRWSRSTISQLMTGKMGSLPKDLRVHIARTLGIAADEVPTPSDLADGPSAKTGTTTIPTPPSYFPPEEQPKKRILRFINHGIPDHLLPCVASILGYFEPFNIQLKVERIAQWEYPKAQRDAFSANALQGGQLTLASGPEGVFPSGQGTFIARVNRYKGYALVAKADTSLRSVSEKPKPEAKLNAFLEMMETIANRGAVNNAAFIDSLAGDFYRILWDLFNDLENASINVDAYCPVNEVSVLEMLDEIGRLRADFVVGSANAVASARTKKARYKVLVEYDDIEAIINAVQLSKTKMERLSKNPKFDPPQKAKAAPGKRSDQRLRATNMVDFREEQPGEFYAEFRNRYRAALQLLMLNNVWGLNVPILAVNKDEELKALVCRVAGVAYRTVSTLLDEEKRDGALGHLLTLIASHPDSKENFRSLDLEQFRLVWNSSFELTPYDDNIGWLKEQQCDVDVSIPTLTGEDGTREDIRNSLRHVMDWMAKEKAIYERLIKALPEPLNPVAREHRQRAEHHYSIYSYWDAARYAEKALSLAHAAAAVERGPDE